jgi:hypothetical protein
MLSYIAYGLGIRSALPLPELVAEEAAADVTIRLGKAKRVLPKATSTEVYPQKAYYESTTEEAYLFWENVGAFSVRRGCEIVVEPAPGVEERVLRLFVLGAVLAVLLQQRGWLVLHASAVAVDGGAVAFLGQSGWGKSTTAAAMHARGHKVVADDVVAVQDCAEGPVIFPGFPQLKLWPETAVALGDDAKMLPRLHPRIEKRARAVSTEGFSQNPLPLRQIYVLAESHTREVEPLPAQEALVELVRHSYAVKLLRSVGASSHFLQCASLVKNVSVSRLKRSRSLQELPDLVQIVEDDLTHEGVRLKELRS